MITNRDLIDILIKSGADVAIDSIRVDQTFKEMGLDSLDVFNFLSLIDDDLGIEISDEDFEKINTIEDVCRHLNNS